MDTRWKNIRYAWGTKAIAVLLVWLCFVSMMGSGVFLMFNHAVANSGSYYETYDFKQKFGSLLAAAAKLNLEMQSEERIKDLYESYEAEEERLQYFYDIKSTLDNSVNFMYCIRNRLTGETRTNISSSNPAAVIEKQPGSVYISSQKSRYPQGIYVAEVLRMLRGTEYEVFAAVQNPLKPGDGFYDDYMEYTRIKSMVEYAYPVLAVSAVLLVISAAYLAYAAGRSEKGGSIALTGIDRLYLEVHTILVLFAAFVSLMTAANTFRPGDAISWVGFLIILGIDGIIGISYVLSIIRQCKAGMIFKNTFMFQLSKQLFRGKLFKPSTLILLFGYGLINGILCIIGTNINSVLIGVMVLGVFIAFNVIAASLLAKSLNSLTLIMEAARQIASGNMEYVMDSSDISPVFLSLSEDISSIQSGLKKAVDEAVKGERMKTELITNVSHDLKTPLTSIVNYVDLLKGEDLDNARAEEYVGILEEKSGRMKQLVEDLVEASKASSGSLPVYAEKVDLHELVLQALGEYEEKIGNSGLDIRINAEEKNTYIYADGKHMWRVIENLLSNAVKYSLPHSRVYINIEKGSEYAALTIKNISANPLDIPPEQLTERFVRGDASRNTEGSGLGLSIAQSLTRLQGGKFSIDIDGDLFKIIIAMPLYADGQES